MAGGRVSRKSAPVRRELPAMGAGATESIRQMGKSLTTTTSGNLGQQVNVFGRKSICWVNTKDARQYKTARHTGRPRPSAMPAQRSDSLSLDILKVCGAIILAP